MVQYPRIKLYADENVSPVIIAYLRRRGVNVITAKQRGHTGRPDEFHYSAAFKLGRFLLTSDRDFLDPMKHRLKGDCGIIYAHDTGKRSKALLHIAAMILEHIIPRANVFDNTKIEAHMDHVAVHWRKAGKNGKDEGPWPIR